MFLRYKHGMTGLVSVCIHPSEEEHKPRQERMKAGVVTFEIDFKW